MDHLGLAFGMVTCMQSDATMLDPLQRLILHGRIVTCVSSSGSGHSDRRSKGLSSKHLCTVVIRESALGSHTPEPDLTRISAFAIAISLM